MTEASRILHLPAGPLEVTVQGEGPTLVLLPSLGRGQEDFDGIAVPLLAAGLRLLRPEPRGIGRSAPLAPGATLHDMAADVAAALRMLGGAPALAAGHAAGNWVARTLAHDEPGLVKGVAMLAAVIGGESPPDIRASIDACADASLPDAVRLHHLARAYFAPGHDARVWLAGWHRDVALAQRRASQATTDRAWLRAAERVPLLYVGAEHDVISPPPTRDALRGQVGPLAEVVVIPDAGHALLPEQPEATARALVDFARHLWS
ncbi:alpha/beta fold hydrolase [Falsiroseomonas sp. HW251]|uniref:alpha/beta fold hydrolase n=1 Tax=Falsiroseomonas sp. HW251 TaxID=3390998 RepID=UPI003D311772